MNRLGFRVLILFLALCHPGAALAEGGDTLLLKQSGPYIGNVTAYLNPKCMRIEQGRSILVARAPDWQVFWFNASKKTFFTKTFKEAQKNVNLYGVSSTAVLETTLPWRKGKRENIAGLDTQQWLNEGDVKLGSGNSDAIRHVKCWTYDEKRIPEKLTRFFAMDIGLPYIGGVPMKYTFEGKKSSLLPMRSRSSTAAEPVAEQTYLETKEAKWVTVPEYTFDVPKGFKRTDSFTQVYLNTMPMKDNAILQDLLKNPSALFNSQ